MITIISITIAYLIGLGFAIQGRKSSKYDSEGIEGIEPYYVTIITFILSPALILVKIGIDISLHNDSNYSK
jgi:hypothetical protein